MTVPKRNIYKIACLLPSLSMGGAEKVTINLTKGLIDQGYSVDLVLASATGELLSSVPEQAQIINLDVKRMLSAILPLKTYLESEKPDVLISHMSHVNLIAVLAYKLSSVNPKLIVVEHNSFSARQSNTMKNKLVNKILPIAYKNIEQIVTVSGNLALEMINDLRLNPNQVSTIYNPIFEPSILDKSKKQIQVSWFNPYIYPTFLSVGRLALQKDFSTLISAFRKVRDKQKSKLIILGEGSMRKELEDLITKLQLNHDVYLPGLIDNPYPFMRQAAAFVLSSRWEGLPTVLVEALACGCPVISTDCPTGPREILRHNHHEYGKLVPVGDVIALSTAMLEILREPRRSEQLKARGAEFSVEKACQEYIKLFNT